MKFKLIKLIVVFMSCSLSGTAVAQVEVRHYVKNGALVQDQKQADYTRVYTSDSKTGPFSVAEYHPDGWLMRTAEVKAIKTIPVFDGVVTTFYKGGQKQQESSYIDGVRVGPANFYYANGQLKKVVSSPDISNAILQPGTGFAPDTLVHYFDSLGNQLVVDGNGFVREMDSESDYEEGEYRKGLREGEWKGTFRRQQYGFTEAYKDGHLIEGVTRDASGKEHQYTHRFTGPVYGKGKNQGIDAFRTTVAYLYKTPKKAVEAGTGITGSVVVEFVINEKGRPQELVVLEDIGNGTGQAAIHAIRNAGTWTPAYDRGVPVRVKQTLPLRVSTGYSR